MDCRLSQRQFKYKFSQFLPSSFSLPSVSRAPAGGAILVCSFSYAHKKTEPKEGARATSPSGAPSHRRTGRTRRNSPRFRGTQTAAASFSSGATMCRPRGNGERRNTTATLLRGIIMSLYRFGVVRLPIRRAGPPTSSLRRRPESSFIF